MDLLLEQRSIQDLDYLQNFEYVSALWAWTEGTINQCIRRAFDDVTTCGKQDDLGISVKYK
jgi:hypothetical protein